VTVEHYRLHRPIRTPAPQRRPTWSGRATERGQVHEQRLDLEALTRVEHERIAEFLDQGCGTDEVIH
jgi:hypothetical protein